MKRWAVLCAAALLLPTSALAAHIYTSGAGRGDNPDAEASQTMTTHGMMTPAVNTAIGGLGGRANSSTIPGSTGTSAAVPLTPLGGVNYDPGPTTPDEPARSSGSGSMMILSADSSSDGGDDQKPSPRRARFKAPAAYPGLPNDIVQGSAPVASPLLAAPDDSDGDGTPPPIYPVR